MLDIVIIGSGPAGLATAISAKESGLSHVVLDKGSLADAIRRFPTNMVYFSTPEMLEIGGVPFVSSTFRPTRVDSLKYYAAVVKRQGIVVQTNSEVVRIESRSDGFLVHTEHDSIECRNVAVATGYFDSPNAFEVPGSHLTKVKRYYDEPFGYVGQNVAIIGGKNSAVDAALELYRNGANVTIVHRGESLGDGVKYWMLPDILNRIKAGEIKAVFQTTVKEVRAKSLLLEGAFSGEIANDIVFPLIGYSPDMTLLKEAGVSIDPDTGGPVHTSENMETNVPGLFVAGSIAAGRFNNKIFIENGRLHGELIIRSILKK